MSHDVYIAPSTGAVKMFGFGYAQALGVTGQSRVAQRFLKFLLTPRGSDPSGNVPGTALPEMVGANMPDPGYARIQITQAVADAEAQVKAAESGSGEVYQPEGPWLASAKISRMVFDADRVDVYVDIRTTDNGTLQIQLPLATSVTSEPVAPNIARYGDLLQGL